MDNLFYYTRSSICSCDCYMCELIIPILLSPLSQQGQPSSDVLLIYKLRRSPSCITGLIATTPHAKLRLVDWQ